MVKCLDCKNFYRETGADQCDIVVWYYPVVPALEIWRKTEDERKPYFMAVFGDEQAAVPNRQMK